MLWMSGPMVSGRNTRDARGTIDPNQSDDDLNVEWTKFGSITRRNGFRRVLPDTFTNGARGLARYVNKEKGKFLIIQGDDKLISYKGDDYPYHDRQEIIPSGLSVIERSFVQMNDWIFMSSYTGALISRTSSTIERPKRYNRYWNRGVDTVIEGVVRNMGLPSVDSDTVTPTPSGTGGSITFDAVAGADYYYRFAYQFYDLGEGRSDMIGTSSGGIEVDGGGSTSVGKVTFDFTGLNQDANEVRVYRTLHIPTSGGTSDGPYYYVGSFDPKSVSQFVDTKADSSLVDPMPLQPLFNDDLFPEFKHMSLHQNRTFMSNVEEVTDDDEGDTILAVEEFPYRLYYSDLYQPDRIMGFLDMPTRAPINGIVSFYDQLVIFQPSTTLLLTGTGPASFVLRTVDGSKGCVAPRSIDILENHVLFLSGDGVCAYNGSSVKRISEAIRNDLVQLTSSRQSLAAGASHKGTYRMSLVKED